MTVASPSSRIPSIGLAMAVIVSVACAGENGGDAIHVDAAPRIELIEDVRIGDADDPDSGFSAISSIDVDRDGNVYVFEAQAMEIRVHNVTGARIGTIGRKGSGPGEFEGDPLFGVVGDTVWASDLFRRRITLFDRRGRVLSTARVAGLTVQLHAPEEVASVLPISMRDDGLFDGAMAMYTFGDASLRSRDTIPIPRVLFDARGAIVDTVGWDSMPPRLSDQPTRITVGSRTVSVPRPPPADRLSTSLPDGRVVVAMTSADDRARNEFTVARLGMHGDTMYRRRFISKPEPFRESELDSIAGVRARRAGPDSATARAAIRRAMSFPRHRPPVVGIERYDGGEVWLDRGDDGAGSSRWIVLDGRGNSVGGVSVPRRNRVVWSDGETLWMVEPDGMDVPWLVGYRVRRTSP